MKGPMLDNAFEAWSYAGLGLFRLIHVFSAGEINLASGRVASLGAPRGGLRRRLAADLSRR